MKLRVILTGATGMVGEGVLHECLFHNDVEQVLVLSRKPCGVSHPKLTELLHPDFLKIAPIEERLKGYNACFFCLGVSSIGLQEPEFKTLTHGITLHIAEMLSRQNPEMTFCYISGAGTDSTEKGSRMWARVKGKTENDLMKLPFKQVFALRPGYLNPTPGLKNTLGFYLYVKWMYPAFRALFPAWFCSLKELGLAMIHATQKGYATSIIEVKDIVTLAKKI